MGFQCCVLALVLAIATHLGSAEYLMEEVSPEEPAEEIVEGLTRSFLVDQELLTDEARCLRSEARRESAMILHTCNLTAVALRQLVDGAQQSSQIWALSMQKLVVSEVQFLRACLHDDIADVVEAVGHHLVKASFQDHALICNGADITSDLSQSVTLLESRQYRQFGITIGRAWRKVGAKDGGDVWEMMLEPSPKAATEATKGFTSGLYGREFDCHTGMSRLFTMAWAPAWQLMRWGAGARRPAGMEHIADAVPALDEVGASMIDLRVALRSCASPPEWDSIMADSILACHGDSVRLDSSNALADDLAEAQRHWMMHNWYALGLTIGHMFRVRLLEVMPETYEDTVWGPRRRNSQVVHGEARVPPASGEELAVSSKAALWVRFTILLLALTGPLGVCACHRIGHGPSALFRRWAASLPRLDGTTKVFDAGIWRSWKPGYKEAASEEEETKLLYRQDGPVIEDQSQTERFQREDGQE